MDKPRRYPWDGFPDVLIHAPELFVKKHRAYDAAQTGELTAAVELVLEALSLQVVEQLWR